MNKSPGNKILLVQLFSNGDCLYATTIARQIKKDYPGCHLTWAVAGSCRNILIGNNDVDEILEINSVKKNDIAAFRRLKQEFVRQQQEGLWQEVFVTQIMDDNQANYDGCIRSALFRGYPHPVTIEPTPILELSDAERENAKKFVRLHNFEAYTHRILFEFAPQSGQLPITQEKAISIAESLTDHNDILVILSSAKAITHTRKNIVDGSCLTLRETAALSSYCTLLLGCSSGITWITTSTGGKLLPMIQLVNPYTDWVNPVSRDFNRQRRSTEHIIDIINFDITKVYNCTYAATKDFEKAKQIYNQNIPLSFRTTRKIVYNLLCYLQLKAIARHIKINAKLYNNNIHFYIEVLIGFLTFPTKLIKNIVEKRILLKEKI